MSADQCHTSGPEEEAEERLHDLGVLFVHGIGSQQRGETLAQMGEAVFQWLNRWIGGEGAGPATRFTGPSGEVSEEVKKAGWTVAVADAHLQPRVEGDPPTARLTVGLPNEEDGATDVQSWLLAEGYWADAVQPPSFAGFCRWGLAVVPWAIASHLGRHLRRILARIRARRGGLAVPARIIDLLRAGLLLLAGPILSMVVMSLVLLVLVLGLIPIPWLRSFTASIQRGLSATLGDSQVLIENPIQEAAIVCRVAEAIEWLAPKCSRLTVVAHSQGAAVSYRALERKIVASRSPDEILFFTFGSGIAKLEEIRLFRLRRPAWTGWIAPVGSILGAYGLFAWGWLDSGGLLVVEPALAAYVTMSAIGLILLGAALAASGLEIDPKSLDPATRFGLPLRWCDRWASSDPVPNGPLFSADRRPSYSVSVEDANYGSMWRDHTVYHRNPDGFMAGLVGELAALSGLRLDLRDADDARLTVGRQRRRFRVRLARFASSATLVLSVAVPLVLLATGVSFAWGDGLAAWLRAVAESLLPAAEGASDWFGGRDLVARLLDPGVVGVVGLFVAGLAGFLVQAVAWRLWNWDDVQDYFWRRSFELGISFDLWLISTLAYPVVLIWVAAFELAPWSIDTGKGVMWGAPLPIFTWMVLFGAWASVSGFGEIMARLRRFFGVVGEVLPKVERTLQERASDLLLEILLPIVRSTARALRIATVTWIWAAPILVAALGVEELRAGPERQLDGEALAILWAFVAVFTTLLTGLRVRSRFERIALVGDAGAVLSTLGSAGAGTRESSARLQE